MANSSNQSLLKLCLFWSKFHIRMQLLRAVKQTHVSAKQTQLKITCMRSVGVMSPAHGHLAQTVIIFLHITFTLYEPFFDLHSSKVNNSGTAFSRM